MAEPPQYKVAKDEGGDEAGLKGGVGRPGVMVAWRASMDGDDVLRGGHARCRRRSSCALTGSGLGHETDGLTWKGASGASSGIRQTLLRAVACRVCATWVSS